MVAYTQLKVNFYLRHQNMFECPEFVYILFTGRRKKDHSGWQPISGMLEGLMKRTVVRCLKQDSWNQGRNTDINHWLSSSDEEQGKDPGTGIRLKGQVTLENTHNWTQFPCLPSHTLPLLCSVCHLQIPLCLLGPTGQNSFLPHTKQLPSLQPLSFFRILKICLPKSLFLGFFFLFIPFL